MHADRLTEATKNAAKVIRDIVKYLRFGPKVVVVRPGVLRLVPRLKCNNMLAANRLRDVELAIALETHCYQINPRGFVGDSHIELQETEDASCTSISWFLSEIVRAGNFLHVVNTDSASDILRIICDRTIRYSNQKGISVPCPPKKTVSHDMQTNILFMIDVGWVSSEAVIKCLRSTVETCESEIRDAKYIAAQMKSFIKDCQ